MMKKRFWILLCILFCSVWCSVLRFGRVSAQSLQTLAFESHKDQLNEKIVEDLFPARERISFEDLFNELSKLTFGNACLNTCIYNKYYGIANEQSSSFTPTERDDQFLGKVEVKVKELDYFNSKEQTKLCYFFKPYQITAQASIEEDYFILLLANNCCENSYDDKNDSVYRKFKELVKIWALFIDEKDPEAHMYERVKAPNPVEGADDPASSPPTDGTPIPAQTVQNDEQNSNNLENVDNPGYPATLTSIYLTSLPQPMETQNAEAATAAALEAIAVAVQKTTAAMETATEKARLAAATETQIAETAATATAATATEEARLEKEKRKRVETQIAVAVTATEQASLAAKRKSESRSKIAISIALGVIGLGAAVFLFIFTQRKRKAAYQMRFEQRRINAVPAPHLFDVEPKARPASAIPSGVSAGGEGNFERSITIEPAEELSDSATMEIDMGSSSVLRYDFGNIQHQGSREYQEDSFGFSDVADPNLVASRGILAVLADGMGGLKNGKSISERTVAKFRKAFMSFTPGVEVPRQLYSLVHETNAEIYQTDKQKGGTTLICVYIYGNSMYWVSVGDSAIYLFRQGRMYQLNREHNRLNDLYLRFMYREITKAQLLAEPTLQGLTSNIGRKELRDVDQNLRELRLRRGDRILLCSDGVSGRLTEKEMLVAMSQGNAQKCTDALKNFVLKKKAPKQDNLTAQVISCD